MPAIENYLLNYDVGQDGVEEVAKVALEDPNPNFDIDSNVTLKVAGEIRDYYISQYDSNLGVDGWRQTLDLISPISKLTKKAPKKTQIFMTMTRADYDKFLKELTRPIEYLDYTPLIRFGDAYGEGGWTLHSIIDVLSSKMGVPVHCSLPDYPISQSTVTAQQRYFDVILSLVSTLEPHIYSVAGHIFITEGSVAEKDFSSANQFSLVDKKAVSQRIVRNDKPTQIRLVGSLGQFYPNKYKGQIVSLNYQKISSQVGSFKVWNHVYGTINESFATESGPVSFSNVPLYYLSGGLVALDPDSGILGDFSRFAFTTTHGKDIFGGKAVELAEVKETFKYRAIDIAPYTRPVLYRKSTKVNLWEYTHYSYNAPRQAGNVIGKTYRPVPARIESIDQMVWYPYAGSAIFGLYANLEEKLTYYWYNENNELVEESTVTYGTVYTDDDTTYKVLGEGVVKDDISPTGKLLRVVINSQVTHYRQLSRDSYGVETTLIWLDTDGRYKSRVDQSVVQAGAVQGTPVELRKMQVYAETGTPMLGSSSDMVATLATPAKEIQIDTPSWRALNELLPIFQNKLTKDEIYREYEIQGELNVHLGLQVDMGTETHMTGLQLAAPALDPNHKPVIVGYQINKDVTNNRAVTRLTVRGRLA